MSLQVTTTAAAKAFAATFARVVEVMYEAAVNSKYPRKGA